MEEKRYIQFLEDYAQNRHTSDQHLQFLAWFNTISHKEAEVVMEEYMRICNQYPSSSLLTLPNQSLISKIEQKLNKADELNTDQDSKYTNIFRINFWKFAAAAMLILTGIGAYYLVNNKHKKSQIAKSENVTNDALPGSNKAILTLADGQTINLDDAATGEIAKQPGTTITKTANGTLIYSMRNISEKTEIQEEVFNTITTPKAGQYQVKLPDGTKVWLNSLSSLKFPAVFTGDQRKVEITGEVYFEVAPSFHTLSGGKTQKIPFLVSSTNQIVEVVGTHFNINSYSDETSTKTTLLEGSVKVFATKKGGKPEGQVKLKPGEQSIIQSGRLQSGRQMSSSLITIKTVNADEAVAWKEGYFRFKDAEIHDVMRQLARWYDIEIVYKGSVPSEQFTGFVSRNIKMSNVLKILEEGGGVKFNIEGKKVEVIKVE